VRCGARVPKRAWLKLLAGAGFFRQVLVELRSPFVSSDDEWVEAVRHLQTAQRKLSEGRWREALAETRGALERVRRTLDRGEDVVGAAYELYRGKTEQRHGMTLDERQLAVFHALQHVTHAAHHTDTPGRVPDRQDARVAIAMTLALLSGLRPD
jgi:hypothetical protein